MGAAQYQHSYLLDSVILIDHFRNIPEATELLKRYQGQCCISVITRAEVLVGAPDGALIAKFLDQFALLDITKPIADLAAAFRKEHRVKLPDAFQAACAQHYGLTLVTRNTKDFPKGKFKFVKTPYELASS